MRPHSSAFSAGNFSPISESSIARARPMSRGKIHVEPQSGTRPMRRNAWMKYAERAHITRSPISAKLIPTAGRHAIHRGDERHRQLAQLAQERMVCGFQHRPGAARLTHVAGTRLQVRARAEAAPRARHDEASHAVLRILDLGERAHEAAQHLGRDCVHHLGMVEGEDADIAIDIEFRALEFHSLLQVSLSRLSKRAFPEKQFDDIVGLPGHRRDEQGEQGWMPSRNWIAR